MAINSTAAEIFQSGAKWQRSEQPTDRHRCARSAATESCTRRRTRTAKTDVPPGRRQTVCTAPAHICSASTSAPSLTERKMSAYLTSSPSSSIDKQMVHFSSVSSSSSSKHIFRSWGILCRETLNYWGVFPSCVSAALLFCFWLSADTIGNKIIFLLLLRPRRKQTGGWMRSLDYFSSLTVQRWWSDSFQTIWVMFGVDAFLNSFHAHICRQLDESSPASGCAHCRPVSLIC